MLLNSIQFLSSFPNEKIGIFLTDNIIPEVSSRLGLRFRSTRYDDPNSILNWGNLMVNQGGAFPELLFSNSLSGFYNPTFTKTYTQPTNFINVPGDFPVFFNASLIPQHSLLLNFRGGLSAITVFPSRPYPVITKVSNNQINISGGLLPLTAVNNDWLYTDYYPQVDLKQLQNLQSNNGTLTYVNSYYSAHKSAFVWKTVTTNPLVGYVFNNDPLPAIRPFDQNIIPQSFVITFPIASPLLPFEYTYTLSYSNTQGNVHYLSALGIESFFLSSANLQVNPVNPITTLAYLSGNADGTYTITVKLDPNYQIPIFNNDITLYYDASSTNAGSVTTTHPAANTFTLSASNPIYFYNHQFSLQALTTNQADAITVWYSPSAALLPQTELSSVSISTVMVDNFYQTHFPISVDSTKMVIKFIETNNDLTLSAIDTATNISYITNSWFPASANIKFINNGVANQHNVSFQLSSFKNAYYKDVTPMSFILNKDKAVLILSLTNVSDNSATLVGSLFPTFDPTKSVRWTVSPPDNIVLYDQFLQESVPLDTLVPANDLTLDILNLGVDQTKIYLYTQEFDISATTSWFPTSSIYSNVSLDLSGAIDDYLPNILSPLSAFFIKNNLYYPVPENGSITWQDNKSDPTAFLEFETGDHTTQILENTIYPSTRNYSNINLNISSHKVPQNPQNVTFNINSHAFGKYYDLSKNKIFTAREYPLNANITAILSASNGKVIDTSVTDGIYFFNNVSITAVAVTADFSVLNANNITWHVPPNNYVHGPSAIFNLNGEFCVSVSAISAMPAYGGFKFYDFVDTICMTVVDSSHPLDFVAFPEYKFFPTEHLATNDNSYLFSSGLTGLSSCVAQTFIVSTYPGFDQYFFRIGDVNLETTSNVASLEVSYKDVSANNAVSVSAFSEVFSINDPLTIFNFASSNNANIFKQFVTFNPYPATTVLLSVDNTNVNLKEAPTTIINDTILIGPNGTNIVSGSFTYVLSSQNFIKYGTPIALNSTVYNDTNRFTNNPSDVFSIPQNTSNTINFFVTGSILKNVAGFDFCSIQTPISSNIVTITAYDAIDPKLKIFTQYNLHHSNDVVTFINETPSNFPEQFQYFVFDDGAGHMQTVSSYNASLTGFYPTEGVFDVSLSGVYSSGRTIANTWDNFIIVKDTFQDFDDNITRQFPNKLELPYSCEDIKVPPNSWQYASTINRSIEKIKTNFYFLSDMSVAFNTTEPKYFIGWVGEQNGAITWNYDNTYSSGRTTSKNFDELKDFFILNDKIFLINGNNIELRANNYNLDILYSSPNITEGELFENPIGIVYNSNLQKLLVLDNTKKFVYVFDVINNIPVLTHYWGGEGDATSRTKLNNPTDLFIDRENTIFIVDSDSLVVKTYNKFLNWTSNIFHTEWTSQNKPQSITADVDQYYILSTNGTIYVYDYNYNYIKKFQATTGSKLYTFSDLEGLIYIVSDKIYVFTRNGLYLNYIPFTSGLNILKMAEFNKELFLINNSTIFKLIDYVSIQSVKNDLYSLSAWNWDSIYVQNNESETAFVFNDSFKKIHDNLLLLGKDIKSKFISVIDEYDNFLYQSLSAIKTEEIALSTICFKPLGVNEIVSYETINRFIDNVCTDTDLLKQMLDVRQERLTGTNICWTWEFMTIDGPQNLNLNRKPYSWYELKSQVSQFSPILSGITWLTARSCGGAANNSPICFTWDNMTCCGPLPNFSWENVQCDGIYHTNWQDLENDCCRKPNVFFDDCITID